MRARVAFVAFAFGMMGIVGVADAADKNDPTGTWKWKVKFGEKEFEQSMKIEQKDGKVTGTMSGGKQEVKIEDGTFKDGELKFTVTRMRKDQKFTSKYVGKLTDENTIKGTITTDFGGKENKTDWEAKRAKQKD
jgi:hypothetical protein